MQDDRSQVPTMTETERRNERPSHNAIPIPHDELLSEELERRVELVRERDNVGRGDAYTTANRWTQSEIDSDLLANVERGLYRIWYSRAENSGDFREIALWFEGTLYNWPCTSGWLCALIQNHIDEQCRSIGTFVRCSEQCERDALEHEARFTCKEPTTTITQ